MEITLYSKSDETNLFNMLRSEGSEWECYFGKKSEDSYKHTLKNSITFVAYENNVLCGYIRCRNDDGFGIYIYDLLVKKEFRGNNIAKKLIEKICTEYEGSTVYVMSDADGYYKKQGYLNIGSVFQIN